MVKGSFITPFLLGGKCNDSKDDQSMNPSRMSTSSRFPSLRRLETSSDAAASSSRPTSLPNTLKADAGAPPEPPSTNSNPNSKTLLHLKFSGPSFLDVVAKDRETKEPMYILETVRNTTTVYRLDHRSKEAIRASCVQWPQSIVKGKTSGRTVQMGSSRWRDTEEFLKYGALANFANRKFNIPHWPHALKWKLVPGNSYVCTTQNIKGPIAILDAAVLSAPPRLRIYHNFMSGDAERSQRENIKGVPVILLDYLMTTALIMVTEVQEWLDRPQTADGRVRIPGTSQPAVQKWLAIIHGETTPESPGASAAASSPTLTAVSANWDENSNRHSSGTASLSSGPITPSTPASAAVGQNVPFAAQEEEVPPVPPLPEAVRALSGTASPPQTFASFESLSSLMSPQASSSTSSVASPASTSVRGKRPLPTPPVLSSTSLSAPRPWTSHDGHTPSPSTASFERDRPASPASSSSSTSNSRRSRVGRSLTIANIPPLQPPPSAALPLPPKLAQELSARSGETSGAGPSMLQAANPDPLSPDEEERLRRNMQALSLASQPPPPAAPPIMPYSPPYDPNAPHRDAGAISMVDASRRRSYAETVYEQPPPAYDAIDFSLPHLHLPRR
ncbi:hypothetical protein PsYK624_088250 [Phanerochaete sordida]|uniref:Uncharacterized protein n=1 Tax=Phanerochaete sordida TaxID=48140 RepID=A0A9P3GF85_9APHY|nr:hypothetical protein PsYK624_088250 [Phanerochaete sordida]